MQALGLWILVVGDVKTGSGTGPRLMSHISDVIVVDIEDRACLSQSSVSGTNDVVVEWDVECCGDEVCLVGLLQPGHR